MIREYVIDLDDPEKAARGQLEMLIDQRVSLRDHPYVDQDELEWEIRLYRFMLLDPVRRLEQYREIRGTWPVTATKRQAVRKLAWIIP